MPDPEKKNSLLIVCVICLIISVGSMSFAKSQKVSDSTIYFTGHIYDTITTPGKKIQLKGKLILERLPYGSEIGIISTNDTSGLFEYYLAHNHDYSLVISAPNHTKYVGTVETKKWSKNGRLTIDYYLRPELKANQVIRLNNLIFDQGLADIKPESLTELNQLVSWMREKPGMVIQLEGHTDFLGNPRSNMELSEQRVLAVRNYLLDHGIQDKRIKTKAYGGTKPLSDERSERASRLNRRVEVRILKTE